MSEDVISKLRSKPNFYTGEYKYQAFLSYARIKVGMMVIEVDDCDKPNPVPLMCKVEEIGTGATDIGNGVEKPCYVLNITAYAETGTVIYDWILKPVIPNEPDEDFGQMVYFRTKEEAVAFGIDPMELVPADIVGNEHSMFVA